MDKKICEKACGVTVLSGATILYRLEYTTKRLMSQGKLAIVGGIRQARGPEVHAWDSGQEVTELLGRSNQELFVK